MRLRLVLNLRDAASLDHRWNALYVLYLGVAVGLRFHLAGDRQVTGTGNQA